MNQPVKNECRRFSEDGYCLHRAIEWLECGDKFDLAALQPYSMLGKLKSTGEAILQPVEYSLSGICQVYALPTKIERLGFEVGDKGIAITARNGYAHAIPFRVYESAMGSYRVELGPSVVVNENVIGIFIIFEGVTSAVKKLGHE